MTIFLLVIVVLAFVGSLVYRPGVFETTSLITVESDLINRTITLLIVTAISFGLGATSYSVLRGSQSPVRLETLSLSVNARRVLFVLAALPLAMVVAIGDALWQRTTYLTGAPGSLLAGSVTGTLVLAGIGILGLLSSQERGPTRRVALGMAIFYWPVLFALGSRQFALAPLAFAAGSYLGDHRPNRRRAVGGALVLAVLLTPLPVYLRQQAVHGLLPYFESLFRLTAADVSPVLAFKNLLAGFPVIGFTAHYVEHIPAQNLLIAINPLPGRLAGWYEIADQMRINIYVPYAGIGEIGNVGWGAVVTVWAVIGAVMAYLEGRAAYWMRSGAQVGALVIVSLCALFAVQMTQYNARSGSRLLWYALAADLGLRLVATRRVGSARRPLPQ